MKKKSFTLIEVVIAMVLMGVLVGFLFKTHLETTLAASKLEEKKHALAREHRFYFRLLQIFSYLPRVQEKEGQLIIHHQNDLDREETFRGPLTSLLYLRDKNIYLATWPEEGEQRLELVWENAQNLSFTLIPEKSPTLLKVTVDGVPFPFFL